MAQNISLHVFVLNRRMFVLNRRTGVDEVRDGQSREGADNCQDGGSTTLQAEAAATLKPLKSLSSALSRLSPWLCNCEVRDTPCQAPSSVLQAGSMSCH